MSDTASNSYDGNLPPCPLSEQCFVLVDLLDRHSAPPNGQLSGDEPLTPQLVERLRAHVQSCPTCANALKEARTLRERQRIMLRIMLMEGELHVPSTTEGIMQAINLERKGAIAPTSRHEPLLAAAPPRLSSTTVRRSSSSPRSFLRSLFSLTAVAALVLASFGLFGYLVSLRTLFSSKMLSMHAIPTTGWSSAVMTFKHNGSASIHVYDPVSGKNELLASTPFQDGTSTEGVSHDGTRVLYYVYDGRQTSYYLEPSSKKTPVFTLPGKGGHTIWGAGDHDIFVSTAHGVEQVDIEHHRSKLILPTLVYPDLRFYSSGYLYYLDSHDGAHGLLYRSSIARDDSQVVTKCPGGSNFWLSSSGSMIYYVCSGQQALYAVRSDGSNPQMLRVDAGEMIGYADDKSPLVLEQTNGRYQVVKLGADASQDQVELDDVAPGASSIPVDNVAVAPYGHALIIKALYGNNQQEIWYGDLSSGDLHLLLSLSSNVEVRLGGWTRIQVPSSEPPTSVRSSSFDDWHGVLLSEADTLSGLTSLYNVNTLDGSNALVETAKLPASTLVDGVAPDGVHVLYQYGEDGRTSYHVFSQPGGSRSFYTLPYSEAGNAIWMPDSRFVLIATAHRGVLQVDTVTGTAIPLLPSLQAAHLTFYRYPYLYFLGAGKLDGNTLYRINVSDQTIQQVTYRSPGSSFWLSPDGFTVYYVNKGTRGQAGIYAVDGDSSHQRFLSGDGMPIGYAADDGLVVMRQVGGKFQVVELADTQRVLLNDAVPGAVSLCNEAMPTGIVPLCDGNIALAPLGRSLVVAATYADGSHKLWFIDLQSGKRLQLSGVITPPHVQVQLIGWDKLSSSIG